MSPLDAEREKLEGVPLTVCTDCKEMVLQVSINPCTNFSLENGTWAEFSTLEVAVSIALKQNGLKLKTRPEQLLVYVPLDIVPFLDHSYVAFSVTE